jgi:phenylacetate-coenzyme A ligase PaaK-like adenylate-forming protein
MDRLSDQAKRLRDVAAALGQRRALAERERWPRERLERYQQERLEALVRHAVERSSFWRERLPRGRVRIEQLPILTKAEMMDRYDDLVTDRRLRRDELLAHLERIDADELYLGEFRAMTTSGSSGTKGLFVYGREAWVGLLAQFLRYGDWAGVRPRLPRLRVAAIGGAAPTHMTQRVSATIGIGLHRVRKLAVTLPIAELVGELNAFRPQFLNAYPSLAAQLAEEQLAGRLALRLEGMSTSSEILTPQTRQRIEAAFGVRPTDLYGTTEGIWGCECERRDGLHLFEDMCLVENVDADGSPVPRANRAQSC